MELIESDPAWYKDAIIYELHVRAFFDSNADGIGDFKGLTKKLDYLQDLGITTIWLLPFCSLPLRDDGYDISDYTNIHPNFGTRRDFQAFVREAHRRMLRVITELNEHKGLLVDATWDQEFQQTLLVGLSRDRRVNKPHGDLVMQSQKAFRRHFQTEGTHLTPTLMRGEQSNTSISFGDQFLLKLYRRMEVGTNPDLEIGRFLSQKQFPHTAPLAGASNTIETMENG